ncbi:MAG: nucleotidyltransferase family protein [Patescibacteria group bacterium]
MVNKIVVLAAGKGTRMLELSKEKPKHLIHIKAKPFIYYLLQNIKKAGFKEIILVIGYKKEKMAEFAEKYKNQFNLILVDQFKIIGKERYGTACPVESVKSVINGENFIVINGDDLYSIQDLKKIKNIGNQYSYVASYHHQTPQYYGLHKIDKNGFLKKIIEKPKPGIDYDDQQPLKYSINIGMYKFTPEIFKAVKKIKKSARGEYEITDAITLLAKEKKVKVVPIKDGWKSFTNPDDIKKMEQILSK